MRQVYHHRHHNIVLCIQVKGQGQQLTKKKKILMLLEGKGKVGREKLSKKSDMEFYRYKEN